MQGLDQYQHGQQETEWEQIAWIQLRWEILEEPLREKLVRLVRASWLVDVAEAGGVLQRRQDLPEDAFVGLDELKAAGPGKYVLGSCLRIIAVSCPWLQPSHPDPHGESLRIIAKALKLYMGHCENRGKPYGVLMDFTALPQAPRTPEEEHQVFKLALPAMGLFYSHPQTVVLQVTKFPQGYPDSSAHKYDLPACANRAAYVDRGWCFAEAALAALVKSSDKVLDLSRLHCDNDLLEGIIACRVARPPPLRPDDFTTELGKKTFTSRMADFDAVSKLYSDSFELHLKRAEELDYAGNLWELDAVRKFLQAIRCNRTLLSLNLGDNCVGLEGAVALGEALRTTTTLHSLELPNCKIGSKGVIALGQALRNNGSLRSLNLYKNGIASEGAVALAEALRSNTCLQDLNLRRNVICDDGAVALAEALRRNSTLRSLQLYGNGIGPKGAAGFGEALKSNTSLRSLRLGENEVCSQGAAALGEGLRGNFSLQRLDLRGNEIGPDPVATLHEALRSGSLQELDMRDNSLSVEATAALREAVHAQTRLLL